MDDQWKHFLHKSKANMDLAQDILANNTNPHSLGLAAFHAQQAVELSVKALIFKFDLRRFVIQRELTRKLFVWSEPNDVIKQRLLQYLRGLRKFRWLEESDGITFVKVREMININSGQNYVTLLPDKKNGLLLVKYDNKVLHEMPLKVDKNRELIIYTDDKTFRNHDPLLPLLEEAVEFSKMQKEKYSETMDAQIFHFSSQFLDSMSLVIQLMKRMDSIGTVRLNVWKLSLGMDGDDADLRHLLKSLKDMSEKSMVDNFTAYLMEYLRTVILDLFFEIKKKHRSLAIKYQIIPEVKDILRKHSFPESLVDSFLEKDVTKYRSEVQKFTVIRGGINVLSTVFAPNGLLKDIQKLDKRITRIEFKNVYQSLSEFSKRYSWMSYLASLAYIMLLIYPHETLGRYPESLDEIDTEAMYIKTKSNLEKLIAECNTACKNMSVLMS